MTDAQITALVTAVVLVFWAVGAYNRLVALRDSITQAFAPVDAQVQHRHQLLMQWATGLQAVLDQPPALYEAVQAACARLQAACGDLRAKPASGPAAVNLRQAEDALTLARQQLQAELPARQQRLSGLELEADAEQLAAADNTLAFARGQFNAAAQRYNAAIRQFPTLLLAAAFGFQAAGTL